MQKKFARALFNAGAGNIGNYSECSFNAEGTGTFKAGENTNPYVGEKGKRHEENEIKIEVIFPFYLKQKIIHALIKAHPYEEVAYDIVMLSNEFNKTGSGLIGELEIEISEEKFLLFLKDAFDLKVIRHTAFLDKPVKKIALCGGAGSFLIENALTAKADVLYNFRYKIPRIF